MRVHSRDSDARRVEDRVGEPRTTRTEKGRKRETKRTRDDEKARGRKGQTKDLDRRCWRCFAFLSRRWS